MRIEPKVFLIAETKIIEEGMQEALNELGVPDWHTDAQTDSEELMEFAGKSCYMSFDTKLNKNLTKTGMRDNVTYLQEGIISTKHGSVLEHATVSLFFVNVSRVLTHEQVRHRMAAYSQTSGRYVRMDKIDYWLPDEIRHDEFATEVFRVAFLAQEEAAKKLSDHFGLDNPGVPFAFKKRVTSAIRRIIGNGQANNILVTANHRALRHIIEQRTSIHAEEEIRRVWTLAFSKLQDRYPGVYADASVEGQVTGPWEVKFKHGRV